MEMKMTPIPITQPAEKRKRNKKKMMKKQKMIPKIRLITMTTTLTIRTIPTTTIPALKKNLPRKKRLSKILTAPQR